MIKFILALFISALSTASFGQKTTRIIALRHAEKFQDKSKNPPLSSPGLKRAESLSDLARIFPIKAIYSSDFKRTRQTATPLSRASGRAINIEFGAKQYEALYTDIKDKHKGSTVVVFGHSNTIPKLVNHIIGKQHFGNLKEDDFDKIFFVELQDSKINWRKLRYTTDKGQLKLLEINTKDR